MWNLEASDDSKFNWIESNRQSVESTQWILEQLFSEDMMTSNSAFQQRFRTPFWYIISWFCYKVSCLVFYCWRCPKNWTRYDDNDDFFFPQILIYCRSCVLPEHHWPVDPNLFTLDVVFFREDSSVENRRQNVYNTLVDAVADISRYAGYVIQCFHGLVFALLSHMCVLLSHPQQRTAQDEIDIPKALTMKSRKGKEVAFNCCWWRKHPIVKPMMHWLKIAERCFLLVSMHFFHPLKDEFPVTNC